MLRVPEAALPFPDWEAFPDREVGRRRLDAPPFPPAGPARVVSQA